jgi:hypothetical protein
LPLNAAPVRNYQLTNNDTTTSNSFSYKLKNAVNLGTAQLSLLVRSSSCFSLLPSADVLTSQQMGYKL